MTTMLPEVMDAKEAAAYLRLSVYTVNTKCRKGDIPATKFGGHWYIRVEDLAQLFDPTQASPEGLVGQPSAEPASALGSDS